MATAQEKEAKQAAVDASTAAVSVGKGRLKTEIGSAAKAFSGRPLRAAGDLSRYKVGGFLDDPYAAGVLRGQPRPKSTPGITGGTGASAGPAVGGTPKPLGSALVGASQKVGGGILSNVGGLVGPSQNVGAGIVGKLPALGRGPGGTGLNASVQQALASRSGSTTTQGAPLARGTGKSATAEQVKAKRLAAQRAAATASLKADNAKKNAAANRAKASASAKAAKAKAAATAKAKAAAAKAKQGTHGTNRGALR